MWVEAVSNESPILATARTLCRVTSDGCVSAAEVARKLWQPTDEILRALEGLADVDWVTRFDDDWTIAPTPETRWVLRQHPSLTLGKRYEVLEITGDYYRVLNNSDDPVLFHNSCFRVVDSSEPIFWERTVDEDGIAAPAQHIGCALATSRTIMMESRIFVMISGRTSVNSIQRLGNNGEWPANNPMHASCGSRVS